MDESEDRSGSTLQTSADRALQLMRITLTEPHGVDVMLDLLPEDELRELVVHACAVGVLLVEHLAGSREAAIATLDACHLHSRRR